MKQMTRGRGVVPNAGSNALAWEPRVEITFVQQTQKKKVSFTSRESLLISFFF